MRKIIFSGLCVLSLSGCGAAPSDGADEGSVVPSPPSVAAAAKAQVIVGEGTELVAQVDVSSTHTIGFYHGTESDNFVFEFYDLDNDRPVLKGQKAVENGHYADLYQRLAGVKVDTAALSRLRQVDEDASEKATASPEVAITDTSGDTLATGPALRVSSEPVEKDFWSDADWFRNNACGGCVGDSGNRQGFGEPLTWPTCTSAPEVCEFFGPGTSTLVRKSHNYDFFTANFATSGDQQVLIYYAKPDEVCNFFNHILTMNCGWGGTQIASVPVPPRMGWGMIGTNPSTARTRGFQTTNVDNVGFKLDLY
jgi:hypothetical protein